MGIRVIYGGYVDDLAKTRPPRPAPKKRAAKPAVLEPLLLPVGLANRIRRRYA